MPATMRDVAALAGVSLKTVSRVVNLEPHTRPDVARRVRAAIAELEWVPNGSARSLRTGRTNVLAVAVPYLQRPYHALLAEAVVSEVNRRGMQAAVEPTLGQGERLRSVLGSVGHAVDGVLVLGRPPAGIADVLADSPATVVVQGGLVDGVDCVAIDLVEAAALLARHLVVMGRRTPAVLGFDRFPDGEETVRDAFAASGIAPVIVPGSCSSRGDGVTASTSLLASHPGVDAIVCGSDEVAAGVLRALADLGCEVPGRVAVTGFDCTDDGLFATPSITTIDAAPPSLARLALDLLAERLSGAASDGARHIISPVSLVRRESTLGTGVG